MKHLIISSILTLGIFSHLAAPSRAGLAYAAGQFDPHFRANQFTLIDGVTLGADAEYASDEIVTLVPEPSVNFALLGIASGQRPACWSAREGRGG